MKNFIFLPTETQVKTFQNNWFLNERMALVLQSNLRYPQSRFKSESIFDDCVMPYCTTTRMVRVFKIAETYGYSLRMQVLKPCIHSLDFIAFHLGEKGVVIDKEDGNVICIAEGSFELVDFKSGDKNGFVVVDGNKCNIVVKNKQADYSCNEVEGLTDKTELPVIQDAEVTSLRHIKEQTFSWKACFLRKFIGKNTEAIENWEVDE